MSVSNSSAQHPDWLRVAKAFSHDDLQTHPSTERVMSHCSDDCRFSNSGRLSVGKRVASVVFKVLAEWSVLNYIKTEKESFTEEADHLVWGFTSLQQRKGLFPTWLREPRYYRITYQAKLFFSGEGADTKISRFEQVNNDWENLLKQDPNGSSI